MSTNFDLIIVGAGPAGLTAGIYAGRFGVKTLILEGKFLGGRSIEAATLENFPGFPNGITGSELMQRMAEQVKKFGAEIRVSEEVVNLNVSGETKIITTRKEEYRSLAVIISTGTQRRKLRVPGETEFLGRGVSYCSICDGAFFRGLSVTVVGSGSEAVNDALSLAKIAQRVSLIAERKGLDVSDVLRARVAEMKNFRLFPNTRVKEIKGETAVDAIVLVDTVTNKQQKVPTSAVFISLGSIPTTQIVKKAGINVDKRGCIKIDRQQRTNVEGVFAAGDCTCGGMQIVTAAGEGAMAAIKALTVIRRLKSQKSAS